MGQHTAVQPRNGRSLSPEKGGNLTPASAGDPWTSPETKEGGCKTEQSVLCPPTCTACPEESGSRTQKVELVPGARGRWGVSAPWGQRVRAGGWNVLETGRGNICTRV